jgi:hypothetical protein
MADDGVMYSEKTWQWQKVLVMKKLEFSSVTDCFVWVSETIGMVWFSDRFSTFRCISNFLFLWGKDVFIYQIKCNKRKNNVTLKEIM